MFEEQDEDEGLGFLPQDMPTNFMLFFMIFMAVVLVFMNPQPTEKRKQMVPPAGKITVELFWCPEVDKRECNIDVDSWTQYKGSEDHGYEPETPVGYSNLGGVTYNLQRDDLGHVYNDPKNPLRNTDPVNYEITASRGLPPGQHCVNTHLYNLKDGKLPVQVKALIQLHRAKPGARDGKFEPPTIILEKEIGLLRKGHEKNIGCFFIDEKGEPMPEKAFQSDSICLRSPHNMQTGECQDNDGGGYGSGGP